MVNWKLLVFLCHIVSLGLVFGQSPPTTAPPPTPATTAPPVTPYPPTITPPPPTAVPTTPTTAPPTTPTTTPTTPTTPTTTPTTPTTASPTTPTTTPTALTTATTTPSILPNGQDLIPPEVLSKLKLSLTILYDAMDQPSQLFFNTTLEKTLSMFYPYVELSFIPCQRTQIISGDLYCFSAIDSSCYLNKLHACAIAQTTNKLALTQFIMCTMTGTAVFPDYEKCCAAHGIDPVKLKACADSDVGKLLCIDFIKQKIPGCNTMPGFIFAAPEGVSEPEQFDHFANNACSVDFSATICGQLKSSNKFLVPKECDPKVDFGIFYKVIDENSQKMFDALAKIYDKFSQFFIFKYNPCAFAEYHNGQLDCKSDGDKDCISGKWHSCAISTIQDPAILFKYLACTMKDPKKLEDYEKCAIDTNAGVENLKTCVDTDSGKFLCYENSKKRPQTDAIPAFSFDMNFNDNLSKAIKPENLQFTLCQQLRNYNATYPEECKDVVKPVKLSIFYESMDYDFQCFMATTFAENYDTFAPFVQFDFVPCRGAKEENGDIVCQSGIDPKCDVDKFESCTVKNIKDQTTLVKILVCLMQNEGQQLPPYSDCLTSVQCDINTVQGCATSDEGKNLCIENLKKSPKNDRRTSFQINDKYDEGADQQLFDNFVDGLCNQLMTAPVAFPNHCYDIKPKEENPPSK